MRHFFSLTAYFMFMSVAYSQASLDVTDDQPVAMANRIEERGKMLQYIQDTQGMDVAHAHFKSEMQKMIQSFYDHSKRFADLMPEDAAEQMVQNFNKSYPHFNSADASNREPESVYFILGNRELSFKEKFLEIYVNLPLRNFKSDIEKIQSASEKMGYAKVFHDIAEQMRSRGWQDVCVWISNLTWGLPNSVLGFGLVIVLSSMKCVLAPFDLDVGPPAFDLAYNGKQVYADVSGVLPLIVYNISGGTLRFCIGKMSLGIFEIDLGTQDYDLHSMHEGVHAIQSAVLGPFYLPVIFISSMMSGFQLNGGMMEAQADEWSGE